MEQTPWETISSQDDGRESLLARASAVIDRLPVVGGGTITIPLLCLGIAIIAACFLIPAADENRRLAYERQQLQADLEQITHQVATNASFLKRVADDPTLAERLARQLKMVPEGTAVMELKGLNARADVSPFMLVTLPPPAALPPYRPIGGKLSEACRNPKTQLYLIGGALMLIAAGLVLGKSESSQA